MAGYSTWSLLKSRIAVPGAIHRSFAQGKGINASGLNGAWLDTWTQGNPVGAWPTAGLGNAATCSISTAGAWPFIPIQNSQITRALRISCGVTTNVNNLVFMLVDRLAHAQITISQATGAFSPAIDGTARLASGEGAMIWMAVSSALGTGTNTFSLTYTDEAGGSSTTPTFTSVASRAANLNPVFGTPPFMTLADGDRGARTITNWTLSSGTQTGNVGIALVKPLAVFGVNRTEMPMENDFMIQIPCLPAIHDSACLSLLAFQKTSASQTGPWALEVIYDP